mgnify:CR=1 FL=1
MAPGRMRPMAGRTIPRLPPGSIGSGTQNIASGVGKPNEAGMTATMRYGSWSNVAVEPIADRSAAKKRVHTAWLSTMSRLPVVASRNVSASPSGSDE